MTPFIVAELSANHNGSLARAHQIVDAAADAGADAIKLQTWVPGTMCINPSMTVTKGPWEGRSLMDLYKEAWTPWEWHPELFDHARQRGLIPFSAAFDRQSVDYLESLKVDRHKVASFELVDLDLIRYMASKGKPMILSTGMASQADIDRAFWTHRGACPNLPPDLPTIVKCTSAYPASVEDANLAGMKGFFGCPFGLSDHSRGIGVSVAAAARGASYIEKHLTLSRQDGGLDSSFSLEPAEFAQMVELCRVAAAAIGSPDAKPDQHTELRRSLWVSQATLAGDPLVLGKNVVTARPANGLHCRYPLDGKVARFNIPPGTPLVEQLIGTPAK